MNSTVKKISINAMGIALFVVLTLCLQIPIFENYYLCLGYVAMTVFCYSIGTISGTVTGTIGVVLYCLLTSGLRGMPGWAAGNLILGIIMGLTFKFTKKLSNPILSTIVSSIIIVIGVAISMLIVKSCVEMFLYAQPFWFRAVKNVYAFIADSFIIVISIPICKFLDSKITNII